MKKKGKSKIPGRGYRVASIILICYGILGIITGVNAFFTVAISTGIVSLVFSGAVLAFGLWLKQKAQAIADHARRDVHSQERLSATKSDPPVQFSNPTPSLLHSTAVSEPKGHLDIVIPSNIGDAKLFYHYEAEKTKNVDYDIVMERASKRDWELGAKLDEGTVWLTSKNVPVMQLESDFRANMLSDWIKRGDPYKIYIKGIDAETREVFVYLAFYRTVESMMKGHEVQVLKLTSYSSEEFQAALAFLNKDDELDIGLDYTDDGDEVHCVISAGGPIGKLPKTIEKRLLEEDYARCFVDHIDFDEKDRYVPYIKIYW